MSDLVRFDYQQLDDETRAIVQQRTGEIKLLLKRTAQDIIDIGGMLAEVQRLLFRKKYKSVSREEHNFTTWLNAEFSWSRVTAYKFINVYEKFSECKSNLHSDISASALYLLAEKSTPVAAREEALAIAEEQGGLAYKEAKEIIDRHKLEAEQAKAEAKRLEAALAATSNKLTQVESQIAELEEGQTEAINEAIARVQAEEKERLENLLKAKENDIKALSQQIANLKANPTPEMREKIEKDEATLKALKKQQEKTHFELDKIEQQLKNFRTQQEALFDKQSKIFAFRNQVLKILKDNKEAELLLLTDAVNDQMRVDLMALAEGLEAIASTARKMVNTVETLEVENINAHNPKMKLIEQS